MILECVSSRQATHFHADSAVLSKTQDSASLREVTDRACGNTDSWVWTLTDFHHLRETLRVSRVVLGLAVVLPGVLLSHPSKFLKRYFQRRFSALTHVTVSKTLKGCVAEDKAKVKSCMSGWSFIRCSWLGSANRYLYMPGLILLLVIWFWRFYSD